ncbi:MAG: hypothetical protein IT433_04625 [Phycisphaerales bacterium]|nr:hypothetical protein [Phycisphaerales bacterium]
MPVLGLIATLVISAAWQEQPGVPIARPAFAAQPTVSSRQAIERLCANHRAGAVAQSVRVRTVSPAGKERTGRLTVRTTAEPATIGLSLGRSLKVWASGNELLAVTPRNKGVYFEVPLPDGVSAGALRRTIRAVPVPHLDLAMGAGPVQTGGAWGITLAPFGMLTLAEQAEEAGADWIVTANGEAGPAEIRIDKTTGLLKRISGAVPSAEGPVRVDLVCQPLGADEAEWRLSREGRTPVATLAELKTADAEVGPGASLPNLGLMTPDLIAFSWRDAREALLAGRPLPADTRVLTALVLFRAGSPEGSDGAVRASGVLNAVRKDIDRRRFTGEAGLPVLAARPVAVLELAEFAPARPRELAAEWELLGETLLWTTSGQSLIDRFAPGSPGVVVLVDDDQLVRGVAALDPAGQDVDAVLAEVRALVEETVAAPH